MRTIFGDAAAATLLKAVDSEHALIGPFLYGTDGRGAPHLIVPAGGMRKPSTDQSAEPVEDENGNVRSNGSLFMNGAEIFTFTLLTVPKTVCELLTKAGLTMEDVDLVVFHQANRYMLEHLRARMNIPKRKFCVAMSHCGDTVPSTIPIALKHAARKEKLKDGAIVMLVGFGVGYSWGATLLRWSS